MREGCPSFYRGEGGAWQITVLPLGFAPGLIIAPGALSSFFLTLFLIYFSRYISIIPPMVFLLFLLWYISTIPG